MEDIILQLCQVFPKGGIHAMQIQLKADFQVYMNTERVKNSQKSIVQSKRTSTTNYEDLL